MTAIENNRCYACRKLFCCADCCFEHVKKKHPGRESECPLCRSENLIVRNFDNKELLCHVVFHHLPLYCRICGSEFKNCEDLQSFGTCRRIAVNPSEKLKSPFTPDTPSPLNKTPCGPACPTRSKNSTVDGDYNGNFGSVVSPPEFTRNTSTPMQVIGDGLKASFVFKTPKSPFYAKTPKAASQTTKHSRNRSEKENDSPSESSHGDRESPTWNDESCYHSCCNTTTTGHLPDRTPLRSILSNRSLATMSETSSYATMNSNAGRKRLDVMEEVDENARIEDIAETARALLATIGECSSGRIDSDNRQKDLSSKRVRFSDQFEIESAIGMTTSTTDDVESTDNEVFYEARENMTEISLTVADKLSLSSARIDDENEKNFKREQRKEDSDDTRGVDKKLESPRIAESMSPNESSTSSSRVIMMVVVEKNGSVNTNDLVPLIDSSLKKLVANNTVETLGRSVESPKRENEESRPGTSVVSVDSYMSVSTVECYKTPDTTSNATRTPRQSPEPNSSVASGGGIFAAVAHAMKLAFRNFAGAPSLRNVSREPIEQSQQPSLLPPIPRSSVSPSRVLTSLASALAPRTAKRSRDADESSPPRSSPERVDSPNDERSPVSKRPRGWYRIRAREPIARMRTVTSPRGVSSETQCFQQGSLSVGDTILTLPSRAHQSTQTD